MLSLFLLPNHIPRYKAELTEIRSTTERQKVEISGLKAEVERLRSGQEVSRLQGRIKDLELQVRRDSPPIVQCILLFTGR